MDIILIIIIIFSGFLITKGFKNKLSNLDIKVLNALWLFHISIGIIYYYFIITKGGDAYSYWFKAKQMNLTEFFNNLSNAQNDLGTKFMYTLNYIPANIIGMSFFTNSLFYSLLGFIAFIFFYCICIHSIPFNSIFLKIRIFPFLLFLPSLHYWTSAVGKDTISFLCILMISYGFMYIKTRFPLVIIGLLLSFGIRPHITFLVITSFGFIYIINRKFTIIQRFFIIIISGIAFFLIIPKVLDFSKMSEISINELNRFSLEKSDALSYGGSFVDISSYPYPLKVLTFTYRPFFFDINGFPAVIASFENLLFVLLSLSVLRNRFFITFKAAPLVIQGLFVFFLMGVFIFSIGTSNLGVILRQRNMFLPGMILFILWSFSYKQQINSKNKRR